VACGAAIVAKLGAGFGGCAYYCRTMELAPGQTVGDCYSGCISQFYTPCELWRQFKNNKAEWIGLAACISCGVRAIERAMTPDPPSGCEDGNCPPPQKPRCPPCPAPFDYEIHMVPGQHNCMFGHWHVVIYNQDPVTCECFPDRILGGCLGAPMGEDTQ
jgi:hypothetical protein